VARLVEERNADLVIDQKTNPARLRYVTCRSLWDTQCKGLESRPGLDVTEILESLVLLAHTGNRGLKAPEPTRGGQVTR